MKKNKASEDDILEFLEILKSTGISIRDFCKMAASEAEKDCFLTAKEFDSTVEKYKKRFTRKSMDVSELDLMKEILAQQPEFEKLSTVYVAPKKDIFEDKGFEKSILSAFKSLPLK